MVATDRLIAGWASAAAPPPALTVSQWADEKRMLPETSAARGARWRTDSAPYLRGMMDVVHEPGVKKIVYIKCSQSGGSEAIHNILGYHIDYDPCASLMVHPTSDGAQAWSKERLSDMIRTTPALRDKITDARPERGSHRAESTLALKMFEGGYLALGGANTPNTFARWAARLAMGDDVDRFPPIVGEEGDPLDLLVNRTQTFNDSLVIAVSTPTLKGGRIDTLYRLSDQRRFFVQCPHCGRLDYITWNDDKHFRVAFEDRDPDTARIECPRDEVGGCGGHIDDVQRRQMIIDAGSRGPRAGWEPTAAAAERGLVGFHLPAMIATIGDTSLSSLVERWLTARQKGKESLKVFINTRLAEGWEERGTRMEPQGLIARREDYGEEIEVPEPAVALTAGVDVQDNRFELQVWAWGPAEERWVVDYRVVPGDPKKAETRAALLEALNRRYTHASGHLLPIHSTCIDSGYATDEVYDFVLAHQVKKIYATKGVAGKSGEPIVGKPSEKKYGRNPRPVRLYPINVDDAKGAVLSSLALEAPGPGWIHFPLHLDTVDEEYFAQLCAEHKETRYNKGGVATHVVWVLDRERNEALDTAVLCLAAYRLMNPNIRQLTATLAALPKPGTKPRGTRPPDGGRRVSRSGYLE